MINHYLGAALVRERHGILLAEAEAARQARSARLRQPRADATVAPGPRLYQTPRWLRPARSQLPDLGTRSAPAGTPIVLRDGSHVLVRQVQSADAPLLADGFARLSAASRWMRFLTPKKELSPAELSYFTDLDHHDHEALGALDNGDGRGAGIARFIRHADDPYAADIAVTIVDDWQGRGLGSELLARLSDRARQEGIRRFTALVAAENVAMAGLLRNACASLVRRDSSTREYEIALVPSEEQDRPAGLELLSLPAGCR
jgi:RimJ/RimL family protein N-acetyltransferase